MNYGIRIDRLAGAVLAIGLVFTASNARADDAATGEMIEEVLHILDPAQKALAQDDLKRADKEHALSAVRHAMDVLLEFRRHHH